MSTMGKDESKRRIVSRDYIIFMFNLQEFNFRRLRLISIAGNIYGVDEETTCAGY